MAVTPGIQSVDKIPAIVRSKFTVENIVEFPAGGIPDQTPIINLVVAEYPATERIDMYFDIGQTDVAKDLDVIDAAKMRLLYQDPAFIDGNFETTGILTPKAMMMRCLTGSGLVYLNAHPDLSAADAIYHAPLSLSAGAGMVYYAFPKPMPHFAKAVDPADPTNIFTTAVSLLTIYLRTFETANRFQLVIFK
jgi:hypothetical protein